VVVDMQNDFVREEGSLHVEAAAETLPRIRRLLEAARASGARALPDRQLGLADRGGAVPGTAGAGVPQEPLRRLLRLLARTLSVPCLGDQAR